jgi:hypothetical protein
MEMVSSKTMKRSWLVIIIILVAGQNNAEAQQNLVLVKAQPVYLSQGSTSPCRDSKLIQQLTDSLTKEGFTLIDSLRAVDKLKDFFNYTFAYSQRHDYKKSIEDVKAYYDHQFSTKNVFQNLTIYNYSCVDTLQNYTIALYMAPRAKDEISQNFTLPFNSPYAISSVILSIIKRE